MNFNISQIRKTLFCIGLALTLWRSYDCLQKYSFNNLSTRVSMLKSFETVLPSLVICPTYFSAYNQR